MENIFEVELFKEKGFVRKRCKKCGEYFWTLNSGQEYCGDPPCSEYSFINNPIPTYSSMDDIREAFLTFFERHGHIRIKRYPVVARWRDDVYLVGASIYDFQPWVTNGIVSPPANPLTISQPCIRLTDIDNVGKTGRHLTFFEMMAHHAFNIGEMIYWNNETVEFSFNLLTKVYKIPEEELIYKEGMWRGGGNAGEDFEVLVRGLEVATLVFMHYKTVDNKNIPMKNKIVDTGYGLERIFWLMTGTPTIYDAIFKEEIYWLTKNFSIISPNRELFNFYFRKMSVENDAISVEKRVSNILGLDQNYVRRMLSLYEAIYTVLDHSRTLIFMLGDGIVPSNAGAGYLARLLIRRSLRYLQKISPDIELVDVVDRIYSSIQNFFPEYKEKMNIILEIIEFEKKKYLSMIKQSYNVIEKIMRDYQKKNLKVFSIEELRKIYESRGIPPEIVRKIGEKFNINVIIPRDFYSKLAEVHDRGESKIFKAGGSMTELLKEKGKIPETQKLYYLYPYKSMFRARVLKVIDDKKIILDKTLFYPEGGGQPSDKGFLLHNSEKYNVIDVKKIGNIIVHICDRPGLNVGDEVEGHIDMELRRRLMQAHTATHIILGAAKRVLGYHIWQAGAQKGVERSRLDITHFRNISDEEREKIELISNRIVMENRKVNIYYMSRNDAERKYGFELYQGGVVPERVLRIVEIEGWDAEACGGLHVSRTGEIGLIKIVHIKRIQDGVERIFFKVGSSAIKYVFSLENEIRKSLNLLQTSENLYEGIQKIIKENKELREKLKKVESELMKKWALELLRNSLKVNSLKIICRVLPEFSSLEKLIEFSKIIMKLDKDVVSCLFIPMKSNIRYVIMIGSGVNRRKINALKINDIIIREIGGRGGGKDIFAQGEIFGKRSEKLEDLCNKIYSYVMKIYEA